ncbi:GIY-YIG nuclease family protein [Planktothrix sp. FACHB-1355]|uniref:GIY-YIG nuclease family protein n=1 Tax=Aerosakkonema funiforme FACHB-1375 TaxID=2949571 RepID=A0A926V9F4_9CYAN|nr:MULTISPECIES: GIY-YIG nuclease family protein [Oscillatoriales]MBD2179734.1 GIY-YIG nuclease family protein [Aerosakkonema funiforme FACHB-1375]MBD3561660.1 GIY-YIG nuclease family protein [Planktothrix sp. FACHB-1355]
MTAQTDITSLASLAEIPYLDEAGKLPEILQGKIGVYAIYDEEKALQFVGYSRDVYLSIKQHFVRQPQKCYWLKVQTIEKPNRTILENTMNAWIAENGATPVGNGADKVKWTEAIDVKPLMTDEEKANYEKAAGEELAQSKLLKNVARRVESEILAVLKSRGCQEEIRFNPKLKDSGLLDLK